MPVYNGARWLRGAVESCLSQTFGNFVLVICDNASTDETESIARQFAALDDRVRYHRNQENIGVYRNYDRAFSFAETPYFKWASGNDLCAPAFVEECVALLEADRNSVLAYPRTVTFFDSVDDGQLYARDPEIIDDDPVVRFCRALDEIHLNNAFNGVIRTEVLRGTGLNRVHGGSDILLVAELALRGSIRQCQDPLFFRRMSPSASSSAKDPVAAAKFFSAEGRDIHDTLRWDFYRSCFSVALGAPISWGGRLRCIRHVARMCRWDRVGLWREMTGKASAPPYC